MSGRGIVARAAVAAGAALVLLLGVTLSAPPVDARPFPQATTTAPSPTGTQSPSASPDPSEQPEDEPQDDGTNPTPSSTGTWLALGGAAAASVLAAAVVILRRR